MSEARDDGRARWRRAWAGRPATEWLGWLGALLLVGAMQGPALLAYIHHALDAQLLSDDARQQIFPFFRYVDARLFPRDYLADYYLAGLPAGYRLLLTVTAASGIDPTTTSKWLPLFALGLTSAALAVAARRLGGQVAALVTLALVLGSSLCLERLSGGLPRTFALPLLALGLERLSAGRARAIALLTVLGAGFYPVVAVILGLSLAGIFLLPTGSRGDADDWSPRRRLLWLAGTGLVCALLILPGTLALRPFGSLVTPHDVAEVPEAGPGGRYGPADRAPFPSYGRVAAPLLRHALLGADAPWVPAARGLLGARQPMPDRAKQPTDGVLLVLVLLAACGWTRLSQREAGARRILLLALAAFLAHAVARQVAPFLYLPQRYVLYVVPLLGFLLVPAGIAALLPRGGGDRHPWLRPTLQVLLATALLGICAGRVDPRSGLDVDLGPGAELYRAVAALPPTALIAGWPSSGQVNNIPYASRRPVLLSLELHQAFHRGYVDELRARMQALIAAYFATDRQPLDELRRRWGVTHLLVDRRFLTGLPPRYFVPFDELIERTVAAAGGRPLELLRQLPVATVYRRGDLYLLDLDLLQPPAPEQSGGGTATGRPGSL